MVDENTTQPSKAEDKEERFVRIRRRYRMCVEAIADQRQKWVDDFEFAWVDGKQWDSHFGKMRGSRPKYEFNKLRQAIKQVVNDNRQNTPSIKVRATEEGDRGLAEVRQGLIRNIESESKADEAYDWGGLYAITSGFGCWRVTTEWVDDDAFDQDIRIRRIHNPWSVWFDPAAKEFDRSDARFAFVDDTITREEFVERWPEKDCVNFENTAGFGDWFGKDTVRIAEYWEKTEVDREMVQLSDGSVVDAKEWTPPEVIDPMAPPPVTEVSRRTVRSVKLTVEILSGKETLEGPFEWLDNQIPIVPVWGDIVTVEGRDIVLEESGHLLIRPEREEVSVGESATVHGLTDDMVATGVEAEVAVGKLLEAIRGRKLLAHYARMEVGFLDPLCRKYFDARFDVPVADTMTREYDAILRANREPVRDELRLWSLCDKYGIPRFKAHHAFNDALACALVWLAQESRGV